jgi:hypothetical protein
MGPETTNPFESPRAVDSSTAVERWQPRWWQTLLGLAVAPITFPLGTYLFMELWSLLTMRGLQGDFDLETALNLTLAAYLCVIVFVLPSCVLAIWTHWLTPKSVFLYGVVFAIAAVTITFAFWDDWFLACLFLGPGELLLLVAASFCGCFLPFAAFALYLAYLRRAAPAVE